MNIGQVEAIRPAVIGTDSNANPDVNPTAVTLLDGQSISGGFDLGNGHAERVASVMISTDFDDSDANGDTPTGVAYGASLYASAYISGGGSATSYQDAIVTAQYISSRTDMRAVNNSWGKPKENATDALDGNSLLTLAVDWLSTKYPNVLQVVAGNEDSGGSPLPTDNYNGITIGVLAKHDDGVYRLVGSTNNYNEDAAGDRTSISLLAPGEPVETGTLVSGTTTELVASGTSYAAPHVTGTVALLQQFGENRITNVGGPRWTANSRRHEVMKAVLINSADKIKDNGSGDFLGMEKTVVDVDESDWLGTTAAFDDTIPLDLRLGAGALNAKRALQQFRNGEFANDAAPVPAIGWDLGTTDGDESINKYVLSQPLRAGSYVSLTLSWDKEVLFNNDQGMDNAYQRNDTFVEECCLVDLDLYLMPLGSTDLEQSVARSTSGEMNLEHIFSEIQTTQQYEIWVYQFGSPTDNAQDYSLAWWTAPSIVLTSKGDYDGSGVVDEQDYIVWKNAFGTTNTAADGNGNGVVDSGDYVVWRKNVGTVAGAGSGLASIPEPSVTCLALLSLCLVGRLRQKPTNRQLC